MYGGKALTEVENSDKYPSNYLNYPFQKILNHERR